MDAAETALLLEQEERDLRPADRQVGGDKAAGPAAARDHHRRGMSFHHGREMTAGRGIAIRPLVHMDRPHGHPYLAEP